MSSGARRIIANTGYRLLADAGSKLASLAFYVVMARQLGAKGFGVFTFGLAFVLLATTLANFGQDTVLTREVARDKSLLDTYFANTLALKIVLSIGSLTIAIGFAAAFGIAAQTREVLLLLGAAVSLELLMTTCFATFQAYERMEFTPIALITQRTLTALVGIAALLAGANVVAVSAIYFAGSVIGLALALQLLFRKVARPRFAIQPSRWWLLLRAAAAIGLTTVFAVILFRVDMTMLAMFKSKEIVGQYGAAYRLLEATLFISWSVSSAVYPVFSRLTPSSSPPVGFVFDRGIKLGVALTLPLAAGALVLADPLIRTVYGDDYARAITPLRLLAPAIALYPISYVAASLLVSQHRQRVMLGVYAVLAAQNVLLNLVLIPWLSLDGAALGTSISTVLLAGALVFYTQRTTGRVDWSRVAAGPVLATLAAAAAMVLLRDSFAVAVVAGAAVYLAVLFFAERALYPDDARAVLDLLPARRATA